MKKLWFRRRMYGWGWTPITVEGWVTLLVWIAAVIVLADAFPNPTVGLIPIIILTLIFFVILYKKGERPRWQWGVRKED